jgi:beta propeller repeat protein
MGVAVMRNVIVRSLVIPTTFFLVLWLAFPATPAQAAVTITQFSLGNYGGAGPDPAISDDTVVYAESGYHGSIYWSVCGYNLETQQEFLIWTGDWSTAQPRPAISGNTVVWMDHDRLGLGGSALTSYDLASGTTGSLLWRGNAATGLAIYGSVVVFAEVHNPYEIFRYDISGYDLATNYKFPICTAVGDQGAPRISDNIVVWSDNRNGNTDIYGYDLSAHSEFAICTAAGGQYNPAISGDTVVWSDDRNGADIYGYDLSTHTEFAICTSGTAGGVAISGETVIWHDWRDSAQGIMYLCGYNLSTHEEFRICARKTGEDPAAISGNTVVWCDNSGHLSAATITYGPTIPEPGTIFIIASGILAMGQALFRSRQR